MQIHRNENFSIHGLYLLRALKNKNIRNVKYFEF